MNSEFKENGFIVIRNLFNKALCNSLYAVICKLKEHNLTRRSDLLVGDDVDGVYCTPPFDMVLDHKTKFLSEKCGIGLIPAYTYARIYKKGHTLKKHFDRSASEYNTTIHLGGKYKTLWPVWIESAKGEDFKCDMGIGDGLFFKGCEREHWREPFDRDGDKLHAQMFMSYVEKNGKYAEWAFDKRDSLSHNDPKHWKIIR